MKILVLLSFAAAIAMGAGPGVITSKFSNVDFDLTADPNAKPWQGVAGVMAANGPMGKPTPGHATEIRSRWTRDNLYFLFVCPYEELYLKPDPSTTAETNKLWDWDVAEVFIGTDFKNINLYKEFEMSPRGEWVDLDIDSHHVDPDRGWKWNAEGFKVKARIDAAKKVWYGEMRIPVKAVDSRKAGPGLEMRVNFYRIQGPPPDRKGIAWQPTHRPRYHTPEAFGTLRLGN